MTPFSISLARILIFSLPFVASTHRGYADDGTYTFNAPRSGDIGSPVGNPPSGVVQAGYQSVEPTRPAYYNQALQGPGGPGSPGPTFAAPLPAGTMQPVVASSPNPAAAWSTAPQPAAQQSTVRQSAPSRYESPSAPITSSGIAPVAPNFTSPAPPITVAPSTSSASNDDLPVAIEPTHDEDENSAAEQSYSLEQSIRNDEERIARLKMILANPQSEFRRAEASFRDSEARLRAIEPAVREAQSDPSRAQAANEALAEAKSQHALARERYDLAIQTRKTLQEQLVMLEDKIKTEKSAFDDVTGNRVVGNPMLPATTGGTPAVNGGIIVTTIGNSSPTATPPAALPSTSPAKDAAPTILAANGKVPSKELLKAEAEVKKRKDELAAAEREAQSVSDRLATLERDIEIESKLLSAANKKIDIGRQSMQAAAKSLDRARADGVAQAQMTELQTQYADAEQMHTRAKSEASKRTDRLAALRTQRTESQRFETAAQKNVSVKQTAVEAAEDVVAALKSPFSVPNMLDWAIEHGPRIGVILIVMLGLRIFITLFSRRVVTLMVRRGARGSEQEREDRAKTLLGVFHNAVSVTIVIGGSLMICEEVGIAAGPLMGGAAVFGLAVAFGAQNLIRDYFHGFVILLENQYKLNDILKIGDISGQVEQITLRMTVLRDQEGNVHFMPNGKIDSVTNMTHGWSRAVLEVVVNYDEDPDEVMSVLRDVAAELHDDRAFSELIVDEAEMLGIEKLSDASFTVKFQVKTRPAGKAKIKRELLRRIKRRFEECDIGVPGRRKTGVRDAKRVELPTIAELSTTTRKKAG